MNKNLVQNSLTIKKIVRDIQKEYKNSKEPTNLKVSHALNEFYKHIYCTKLANNNVNSILWSCICDNFENLATGESCIATVKSQLKADVSELGSDTSEAVNELRHDMKDLNGLINDIHTIYNINENDKKNMDNIWFKTDFDDWEDNTFTPTNSNDLDCIFNGVIDDINDLVLKKSDKAMETN